MQIGDFPFDHTENVDPNTAAAYMEVWLQQIRTQFKELPHIQEKVAKEVWSIGLDHPFLRILPLSEQHQCRL